MQRSDTLVKKEVEAREASDLVKANSLKPPAQNQTPFQPSAVMNGSSIQLHTVANITTLLYVLSSKPHKNAKAYCSDLDDALTILHKSRECGPTRTC